MSLRTFQSNTSHSGSDISPKTQEPPPPSTIQSQHTNPELTVQFSLDISAFASTFPNCSHIVRPPMGVVSFSWHGIERPET